jgi:hypothetical protein
MGAVIREPDGRTFPLGNEPVTIGRSRENRLTLTNNQISSRHAEIRSLAGGQYQIVDLDSRNGTTVNGIRLKPHEPRPLTPDDLIGLGGSGGVELRFELIADAPAWGQDQFQPPPQAVPGGPPPGGFGAPPAASPGFGGPPADPGFGGNFQPAFPPAPAQGGFGAPDIPGPGAFQSAQPGGPPLAPFQPAQPGGPPAAPFGPPNQFGPPPGGPPPFGAPNLAPTPGGQPFGGPPGAPPFGAGPGFAPPPQQGPFGPPQGGPGGYPPQPGFPGGPAPRKGGSLRTILLVGGSLLVIVLIVVAVVFALNSTRGGGSATPTPTKPGPTQTPTATISSFYEDLKKQDYTAAAKLFTQDYIAMHGGPEGTAKVLQGFDNLRGKVTNYSIVSSNGSATDQTATVKVTRTGGQTFSPDQLQLTFQKSGNLWQLSSWTPGAPQ